MDTPVAQSESPFEIMRRMENMLRMGTIAAVRTSTPARCRVQTGDLTTNWIPWMVQAAGGTHGRHWRAPVVGEQCLLLAPGGDMIKAVALCGIYSNDMPQGSETESINRTDWSATEFMEHDTATGQLTIRCDQGIIFLVGNSSLNISPQSIQAAASGASLTVNGVVTGAPDVVAAGISLTRHVHGGVRSGPDRSGGPI